jgi:putative transposase
MGNRLKPGSGGVRPSAFERTFHIRRRIHSAADGRRCGDAAMRRPPCDGDAAATIRRRTGGDDTTTIRPPFGGGLRHKGLIMTFWKHSYHIVWGTKERQPWILPTIEPNLYAYLASKAGEVDTFLHAINGTEDHIHIIAAIPPKHSVAWVVKTLKGSSAHFINHVLRPAEFHFAWQRGYGSLTLGDRQRPAAIDYVTRQKEHHRQGTTNLWLERSSDEETDEGPSLRTPQPRPDGSIDLREDSPPYIVEIEAQLPF